MRKFQTAFNGEVDLDDPETYSHLPTDIRKLDDLMFQKIGQALVYMDYFHPDIFLKEEMEPKEDWRNNCGYNQRVRVNALIKHFADNRKLHYDDAMWIKEQIFVFEEETENMC